MEGVASMVAPGLPPSETVARLPSPQSSKAVASPFGASEASSTATDQYWSHVRAVCGVAHRHRQSTYSETCSEI